MSQPVYESIDPETYLGLAKELSSRKQIAAIRTSADRAYYAAFLSSRDVLAKKGYLTPYYNTDDHKYVTDTLKRPDVLGSLGNDEARLRRARNLLTYDTRQLNAASSDRVPKIDFMLNTAEMIIRKVNELKQRTIGPNST